MKELKRFFKERNIKVSRIKKYNEEKFIVMNVDKILLPNLIDLSKQYGDDYIAIYPSGSEIEIIIDL